MTLSKKVCLAAAVGGMVLAGATASARAGEATILRPAIGEPLRDAAVTRAPDGIYYLTGTRCMNRKLVLNPDTKKEEYTRPEVSRTPDGKPDFMNNDGARLWSSKDLKEWKDEGLILDLMQRTHWHDGMSSFYSMPDRPLGAEPVRNCAAPRLQRVGDEWFLTASNGNCDTRWFKAPGPTGPFKDAWKNSKDIFHGEYGPLRGPGHGMLFQDSDGAVWRVRGPGYAERMTPDLGKTEWGKSIFLLGRVEGYPNAEWCAGQFDPHAAAVALLNGKHVLTWAAYTDEAGSKRDDSFYAVADRFEGPYSGPSPLIAGSGPVTLFHAGNGLMASCSIKDAPVLVPVKLENNKLVALAQPELPPTGKAVKPAKIEMFDYAHARPSGKRAERAGEEIHYDMLPVFADREPASVERIGRWNLVPLFDLPMTDVSICKGEDAYYLTGTTASKRENGTSDFENNDGIYLWRSSDLDTWMPLGKVWDIEKDGANWAKEYRIPGDNLLRDDFCRGVTAPEVHFVDGTYYLAYSMNGRGTGLLKSKTGKAEGPYEDMGRITAIGESPSIFTDVNGKRYWLWGKGLQITELSKESPVSVIGDTRGIFLSIQMPKGTNSTHCALGLRHVTGPFMFTYYDTMGKRVRYALSFSAITHTWNRANRDAVIVVAKNGLGGVWMGGTPRMIPHSGQTTVFTGPGDELFAAFWGADPSAVWRDRPGIVPMELWQPGGYQDMKDAPMRWPRKVLGDHFTMHGPWATLTPPKGMESVWGRDHHIFAAPDGYFYYSSSPGPPWSTAQNSPGKARPTGARRTFMAPGSTSATSTPWSRCATSRAGPTRPPITNIGTAPRARGNRKCPSAAALTG